MHRRSPVATTGVPRGDPASPNWRLPGLGSCRPVWANHWANSGHTYASGGFKAMRSRRLGTPSGKRRHARRTGARLAVSVRPRYRRKGQSDLAHLARMTCGEKSLEAQVLRLFDRQAGMLLAPMQQRRSSPRPLQARRAALGPGKWPRPPRDLSLLRGGAMRPGLPKRIAGLRAPSGKRRPPSGRCSPSASRPVCRIWPPRQLIVSPIPKFAGTCGSSDANFGIKGNSNIMILVRFWI